MNLSRVLPLLCVAAFVMTDVSFADTTQPLAWNDQNSSTVPNQKGKSKYPSFADSPKRDYADAVMLLPPPPGEDSKAFEIDMDIYKDNLKKYKGTKTWEDARLSARLDGNSIAAFFSDAMGIRMSREKTPKLLYLIENSLGDFLEPGNNAKRYYKRKRPYVYFGERTCSSVQDDQGHARDGSYPSGYSTYGWGVALILTEINPRRSNQILETGLRLGQNRVICGFHWQSDVDWGRTLASYVVAELHTVKKFNEALAEAKAEFEAAVEEQRKSKRFAR